MWRSGDVIALRDVWHGRVWRAVPGVVVADESGETVVWIPRGTENAYPVDDDGREVRLSRDGVTWGMRRTSAGMLAVIRAGEPWSVWHFWDTHGDLDHWYVNFERPLGRGPTSYDYVDQKLDLIVRPGRELEWKDEDELAEAGRLGLLDPAAVRADAERAVRERPWPTGWETWLPDPTWPAPQLPEGWDQVS